MVSSQKTIDKFELFQKRTTQWILDINHYHKRFRALKLFPISYHFHQFQMVDLIFLNKLLSERDVSTIVNTKREQDVSATDVLAII